MGATAYKLRLLSKVDIHLVFHVSQQKKSIPPTAIASSELPISINTPLVPIAILDRKLVKRGNQAATKVLVQWSNLPSEDATWEFLFDIQKRFPDINLEDKVF